MNDFISRQAAIDRFCELLDTTEENPVTCIRQVLDTLPSAQPKIVYEMTSEDITSLVRGIFENLPSVQPEIIRCKDCKHYNAGFECLIDGYGVESEPNHFCGYAER